MSIRLSQSEMAAGLEALVKLTFSEPCPYIWPGHVYIPSLIVYHQVDTVYLAPGLVRDKLLDCPYFRINSAEAHGCESSNMHFDD